MIKRVQSPFIATIALGIGKPMAVAALCLSMASHVLAEQHSARVQQAPPAPAAGEESVLVATREAPASAPASETKAANAEDNEALEPISQSSDFTPELATAADNKDSGKNFADALAKVGQPPKPTSIAATVSPAAATTVTSESQIAEEQEATAPMGSARRAATARSHSVSFEAVKFQSISVGKTSKHELVTAWGQPTESTASNEGEVLIYYKSPFKLVETLIGEGEVVSSVKITLAAPLDAKQLAEQLNLDGLDSVTVTDDADVAICLAYPERGVLFMFEESETVTPINDDAQATTATNKVAHVALQPIDANAFAYRAESRLHGPYAQNISDLKTAIAIDPEFARAYWLLAKIHIATGQADLATAAAAEACDIEPKNASFQLCHAQARELLGEYDDAVLKVRAVLDREDLAQIDRAQALHQMARLASLGDREIASKTVPFENRAIEIADKLATSKDARERRAAKQLLIEAHIGIAEDLARQPVNEKVETLSQWIGRASGLAEDFIEKDKGSVELRLFIAQRALGALASFKPTLDPAPWVAEAEEAAKTLLAQSNDEMWQQRIKWDLGIAYLNALRVEHSRRETEAALEYGQLAIDNLAIGASCRQAVHSSEQMVGQLYFQMGAVYAVHKLDHAKAVQWYEKAAPLVTTKRPASELYAPRREGEMLVSMGVSYWQLNNQTRALDLTQTGVGLIEAAVESGVLSKSTLAVPYGNLSTMYQQMGENTNATKYAELARSVASTQSKPTAGQLRVGRGQNQKLRSRTR
jgi:Tetratricopeptide repeat